MCVFSRELGAQWRAPSEKPPERFRPAVGEGGEGRDEGDEGGAVW